MVTYIHIYIHTHAKAYVPNRLTTVRKKGAVNLERDVKSWADQRGQPPLRKSLSLMPHSEET